MHRASLNPAELVAREGDADGLAAALQTSRQDTLATFRRIERALGGAPVPRRAELNPPLWELGHIGWFQEYWLARNPQRDQGAGADPQVARLAALRPQADALYDSSRVAHDSRWTLALPDAGQTCADLERQLEGTLALLRQAGERGVRGRAAITDTDTATTTSTATATAQGPGPAPGPATAPHDGRADDRLYFFRLALLHEDMHHEAALYMAQSLGIAIDDARWQARPLPEPPAALALQARHWTLGSAGQPGFAFDNELQGRTVALAPTSIDAQAVRWAEFLPFVEAGAYADPRWWDEAGRRWRDELGATAPRYLRRGAGGAWQQWRHGHWQPLDPAQAACHLSLHEAQAWCRWAGRRLPDEAEWECAAVSRPDAFRWGDVWEWTASAFEPYPGFAPHPYRDYSAPWFDGRRVLRGASFMTQPRLHHPRYRNFFAAHRNDVPAGFRSCPARPAAGPAQAG